VCVCVCVCARVCVRQLPWRREFGGRGRREGRREQQLYPPNNARVAKGLLVVEWRAVVVDCAREEGDDVLHVVQQRVRVWSAGGGHFIRADIF